MRTTLIPWLSMSKKKSPLPKPPVLIKGANVIHSNLRNKSTYVSGMKVSVPKLSSRNNNTPKNKPKNKRNNKPKNKRKKEVIYV